MTLSSVWFIGVINKRSINDIINNLINEPVRLAAYDFFNLAHITIFLSIYESAYFGLLV